VAGMGRVFKTLPAYTGRWVWRAPCDYVKTCMTDEVRREHQFASTCVESGTLHWDTLELIGTWIVTH
jgi:hypothetical protein